ncbi:hypothetical protein GX50_07982 [[Emmonsia] crescens]|uniref:Uncharacterized protein n=1 Tax=[Emmonsia] crescens TaxID=73230 RepID=A0A2B7Z8X1_9EURO|nr:hypothetical protein GX50_07982 [Emmonsia crescens]
MANNVKLITKGVEWAHPDISLGALHMCPLHNASSWARVLSNPVWQGKSDHQFISPISFPAINIHSDANIEASILGFESQNSCYVTQLPSSRGLGDTEAEGQATILNMAPMSGNRENGDIAMSKAA